MRRLAVALSTAFPEVAGLLAVRDQLVGKIRARSQSDRGDIPMGWVLVVAITITIVVSVGTIIYNKLNAKANSLDLTTP
jgi:hypothetical protein